YLETAQEGVRMLQYLFSRWQSKPQARPRPPERRCRPRVEELEPRRTPAIYDVTNTGDAGVGSLRQAIIDLSSGNAAGNAIHFGAGSHGTITLASALPPINRPVRIFGPGWDVTTVTRDPAQGDFRIFQVQTAGTVDIQDLTISGGSAGAGNN